MAAIMISVVSINCENLSCNKRGVHIWGWGHGDQIRERNAWIGDFFSSIYNKPLPGLCFLNLSLLSVETRTAYPLITEQLVRGDVQASAPKAVIPKNSKPGRPKGSVNKNRKVVELYLTRSRLRIFQIAGILGLKVFLLVPWKWILPY